MPSVTGQEMTSDLSIAERLAALKSDHMPGAPVRSTTARARRERVQLALELVRRRDHLVGVPRGAGLHDRGVPVAQRSRCPAAGATTVRDGGVRRAAVRSTLRDDGPEAGVGGGFAAASSTTVISP